MAAQHGSEVWTHALLIIYWFADAIKMKRNYGQIVFKEVDTDYYLWDVLLRAN